MNNRFDYNRFNNEISERLLSQGRLEELLVELGINYQDGYRSTHRGPCPIHLGDSTNFVLNLGSGHTLPIRWACYSHQCHDVFKQSLLGLVRGVLSQRAYGWSGEGDKTVPLKDAVAFLSTFVDRPAGKTEQPKPVPVAKPRPQPQPSYSRETVRRQLVIPSPYFLSRGFSREVLDHFDVGESSKLGRAMVPLYDNQGGNRYVGHLGRSVRPLCSSCDKCHDGPNCRYGQARWVVSDGFPANSYLFNYAGARMTASPFVVLVEGVGDVFRCWEAGLNAVASLGSSLSARQVEMLRELNRPVLIAYDRDKSGQEAAARVGPLLGSIPHRQVTPPFPFKDWADMPANMIAESFKNGPNRPQDARSPIRRAI